MYFLDISQPLWWADVNEVNAMNMLQLVGEHWRVDERVFCAWVAELDPESLYNSLWLQVTPNIKGFQP